MKTSKMIKHFKNMNKKNERMKYVNYVRQPSGMPEHAK